MSTENILWVEKYRPRVLKDIVGQQNIIPKLEKSIHNNETPHFLFRGPAGVGKTTAAMAIVRELFGNKMKKNVTYLELNASDARGIDVMRTTVKDFIRAEKPDDVPFKILILDEADSMTMQAQQSIRNPMEKNSANCRFILICNYSNKIISPIQSRCSICSFSALTINDITERLKMIAEKEQVNIDHGGLQALAYISDGDCRQAINYLQSCANLDIAITEDIVYRIIGKMKPEDIRQFVYNCLEKQITTAKQQLNSFLRESGLSGQNIIKQIHRELPNLEIEDDVKRKIIRELGTVEYRLAIGATEDVQLLYFVTRLAIIGGN